MRYILLIISVLLIFYINLEAGTYPNNYGMSKDWHNVYAEKEYDLLYKNVSGAMQFWDSLNGLSISPYLLNTARDTCNMVNVVLKTNDGGYTWQKVYADTTSARRTIREIDLYDNKLAYYITGGFFSGTITDSSLARYYAAIYKSIDGGYNWKKSKLPFIDFPKAIQIYDRDTIFACYKQHLVKSTDAGKTWVDFEDDVKELIPNEPHVFTRYDGLDIADDGTIFIHTGHSYGNDNILRSKDGGNSWEIFPTPQWSSTFKAISEDTLLFICWDYSGKESALYKVSDSGKKIDTLLFYNHLRYLKGFISVYGRDEMIADFGKPLAYSANAGQTFDSLVNDYAENFEKGGPFIVAWSKKNRMFLLSRRHGDILMYDPDYISVNNEKIHNFQTKLYPNPVFAHKPLNIEIENDRLRNIRISTYNIEGVKLDMSDEVSIPRGFYSFSYQPKMLNTGTYFIVIQSSGEVIAREKFIVK